VHCFTAYITDNSMLYVDQVVVCDKLMIKKLCLSENTYPEFSRVWSHAVSLAVVLPTIFVDRLLLTKASAALTASRRLRG